MDLNLLLNNTSIKISCLKILCCREKKHPINVIKSNGKIFKSSKKEKGILLMTKAIVRNNNIISIKIKLI